MSLNGPKMLKNLNFFKMRIALLITILISSLNAQEVIRGKTVSATDSMIVTRHYLATEVGNDVLMDGGNAIDAAVAISFALAVVLPQAGNIGGGGFLVHYNKDQDSFFSIDYREQAPGKSFESMFIRNGKVDRNLAIQSYLSSGTPGSVHGLYEAHKRFGNLSWSRLINPAIKLALNGFTVTKTLADSLKSNAQKLSATADGKKIFFKNNQPLSEGDVLIQKDLAKTFTLIAENGAKGFYEGKTAKKIAKDMAENDGMITEEDLKKYRSKFRKPVKFNYKDLEIITMPPPSSGGLLLQLMLRLFELNNLNINDPYDPKNILLTTEIMQIAYSVRSEYLGDPDFYDVPFESFSDEEIIKKLNEMINFKQSSTANSYLPSEYVFKENTTHFSVADQFGNLVSNTTTLNTAFGSGVVIKGTGVLMNNEMDDFSAAPGEPNYFGLLGNEANKIEPFKRPLSSMTPTIVFKDGEPFLLTGAQGGSRIITAALQVILNYYEYGLSPEESVMNARYHHQWLPDKLYFEKDLNNSFNAFLQNELQALGFTLEERETNGITASIMFHDKEMTGVSDKRSSDYLAIGVSNE
jgi:gamma-glutamyltranspeptidase/glutathione hydrolase